MSAELPPVIDNATTSAEAKRIAARRRFLLRGAAAGPGVVIVTLCHRRAFAQFANDPNRVATPLVPPQTPPGLGPTERAPRQLQPYQPRGILVSSTLTCASLHGTSVETVSVVDSISGNPVTRVDCVRN
jgi:hypothetical protein